MKKKIKITLLLIMSLFIVACGGPKLYSRPIEFNEDYHTKLAKEGDVCCVVIHLQDIIFSNDSTTINFSIYNDTHVKVRQTSLTILAETSDKKIDPVSEYMDRDIGIYSSPERFSAKLNRLYITEEDVENGVKITVQFAFDILYSDGSFKRSFLKPIEFYKYI